MKKVLLVSALVLTIVTSMVSGTLAVYNVNLGTVATGSVVAKNFVLIGAGDASFSTDLLIAPSETVKKTFTVSNFEGVIVAEVDMDLEISVKLEAIGAIVDGGYQGVITPLTAVLKDSLGNTVSSTWTTGTGTLSFTDVLLMGDPDGVTNTYTVEITWPSTASDTTYAGHNYGTALTVTVAGTQK